MRTFVLAFALVILSVAGSSAHATPTYSDLYYPDQARQGELHLNYYYDRTGRWVKFSDWIPFKKHKMQPETFEDLYNLYSLPAGYNVPEVKESLYFLVTALQTKFRHPSQSLCPIKTEAEFHKYRNLMFMQTNLLIMRMFLRLGSLYDKRHLTFHDLDVADDLDVSFQIARTYYNAARPYWELSKKYAAAASVYPFDLDLPAIEAERFKIMTGKTDFGHLIDLHLARLNSKIDANTAFLAGEQNPRPVKQAMQKDLESMFDKNFTPDPLGPPVLSPERKDDAPLFPE